MTKEEKLAKKAEKKAAKLAKKTEKKSAKKERKAAWKQDKKNNRALKKEKYKNAPGFVRFWNLYLRKILITLVVLVIVVVGAIKGVTAFINSDLFNGMVLNYYYAHKDDPVNDKEKIYEQSPLDKEGGALVDSMEHYGADDTWTICVYMIGSNLEDLGEDDLSSLTEYLTSDEASEVSNARYENQYALVDAYTEALEAKGLDYPEYLYEPNKPVASSTVVTDDVVVATREGCASADLNEIMSDVWSDNITFVIETGGAKRWSNSIINPNKTQRFTYKSGVFSEVESMPLQNMCDTDTLADFLKFCKKNYPADHTMVIFWDHGSGAFGYGSDDIFGSSFSMSDIRDAFAKTYGTNPKEAPIELIGFDACLMSSLEAIHTLSDYTKYMAVSEEVEPGDGWDYGEWIKYLSDDPSLNGAQVARYIADSYMDYYVTENINVSNIAGENAVCFSVIDVQKAEETYEAYAELAKAELADSAEDISNLSTIGSAASRSTRFSGDYYDIFNTIDLGNFMDNLNESYPEETTKVKNLLSEAVLYHRENSYLEGCDGISVYFPTEMGSFYGVIYMLKYLDGVDVDDNIKALYFYKASGCLSEEYDALLEEEGLPAAETLDVSLFKDYEYINPGIQDGYYDVTISEELKNLIQDCFMEVAYYDTDSYKLRYYGTDALADFSDENTLMSSFEGVWPALDGEFLSIELVSNSDFAATFRSKVKLNGDPAYLMISYNYDTEEYAINGAYTITDFAAENAAGKKISVLKVGDKITPIYKVQDLMTNEESEVDGKTVKFGAMSKIEDSKLDSGKYLTSIVISDIRGDEYYSKVVENTVSQGHVTGLRIATEFVGD